VWCAVGHELSKQSEQGATRVALGHALAPKTFSIDLSLMYQRQQKGTLLTMVLFLMVWMYAFSLVLENLAVEAWIMQSPEIDCAAHPSLWHSVHLSNKHLAAQPTIHAHPSRQHISLSRIRRQQTWCFMDNAADSSSSLFTSAENAASSPSNRLLRLLSPVDSCNVDRMSGTDLAYVGDVVYELFVRSRTVWVSGALL
jgi:hypothetical protein